MKRLILIVGNQGSGKTKLTELFTDKKEFEFDKCSLYNVFNTLENNKEDDNIVFTTQGNFITSPVFLESTAKKYERQFCLITIK